MANLRGVATALLLFAGCTAMQPPSPPATSGRALGYVDSVRFQISSWGRPMEEFDIGITGLGEYRRATADGVALEIHRFNAGPEGFARLRSVLAGIEHFTVKGPVCGERMTDFPYGDISWVDGLRPTSVHFDVGCRGADMQRVVAAVHRAARLAEEYSRTHPLR